MTGAPGAGSEDRSGPTPAPLGSLPSGSAPGSSSASRRRALLPGLGGTRRRKGNEASAAPERPPGTYPSMAQMEERVVRGLTGSPRAGVGGKASGGSGDRRAEPLRSSGRSEVEGRVGNRGGDRARSRQRRAPAFPARERVPALPGPAPSASTPSPDSAGLQGALFPPSPLRPAPAPPAPPPPARDSARVRAPALFRRARFRGDARLVLPALRLSLPRAHGPSGFPESGAVGRPGLNAYCCWRDKLRCPLGTFETRRNFCGRETLLAARQGTGATATGQAPAVIFRDLRAAIRRQALEVNL